MLFTTLICHPDRWPTTEVSAKRHNQARYVIDQVLPATTTYLPSSSHGSPPGGDGNQSWVIQGSFPVFQPPVDSSSHGSPPGGDGNQSWVIQGSFPVFQPPVDPSDMQTGRRRGRPSKPKVEGPRRPRGRPKGSGKLQRLLQNANGGIEPKKRRGRPLKEKNSGGITVDYHIVRRFFSY
jgi:hypothetical protein